MTEMTLGLPEPEAIRRRLDCSADCSATVARHSLQHWGADSPTVEARSTLICKTMSRNDLPDTLMTVAASSARWHEDCQLEEPVAYGATVSNARHDCTDVPRKLDWSREGLAPPPRPHEGRGIWSPNAEIPAPLPLLEGHTRSCDGVWHCSSAPLQECSGRVLTHHPGHSSNPGTIWNSTTGYRRSQVPSRWPWGLNMSAPAS